MASLLGAFLFFLGLRFLFGIGYRVPVYSSKVASGGTDNSETVKSDVPPKRHV